MNKITLEELMRRMSDGTIRPGPVRHPQLPSGLLKEIQRLWHSVGKAFFGRNGTMEQWELGFMRDCNPQQEVVVWQRIERATSRYMDEHPGADLGETVTNICLCSMGAEIPVYQKYWVA